MKYFIVNDNILFDFYKDEAIASLYTISKEHFDFNNRLELRGYKAKWKSVITEYTLSVHLC